MTETAPIEFSRAIAVSDLDGEAKEFTIAAEPDERTALAERFDLVSLGRLEATMRVDPRAGGDIVRVTGRFAADVVQTCVVTLEGVPAEVTGEFDRTFASPDLCARASVVEIDVADEDPPDPIVDGSIDIGEVVAEHMGLELNPFPRAPGAEFDTIQNSAGGSDAAIEARPNPFAILEKLKER